MPSAAPRPSALAPLAGRTARHAGASANVSPVLARPLPCVEPCDRAAKARRCDATQDGVAEAERAGDTLAAVAVRLAQSAGGRPPGDLPGLDGDSGAALAALGPLLSAAGATLPAGAPEPLRRWLHAPARELDREALDAAKAALAVADLDLVFARAYERLVRAASRRLLGTYFTPPAVVEFMTDRLADALPQPATVADAGAGVGALTLAAARRWPNADIHAVDVNPASLGLLAVAVARGSSAGQRLALRVQDYLQWSEDWAELPSPRALLANPPYTRHQARTDQEKKTAAAAAGDLVPHRTGSLSSYMLAATWRRLGQDDAMCLLLPDNWLHAAYAADLRTALWLAGKRRIDLYALPEDEVMFHDARVRAMVLLVWPVGEPEQPVVVHRTRLSRGQLAAASAQIAPARPPDGADHLGALWRRGIAADDPPPPRPATRDRGRPLSELVLLRRGIATGSNKTFLLRETDAAGIPPEQLRPAVHRLAHVPGDVLDQAALDALTRDGKPRWLLDVPQESQAAPAAAKLLNKAKAAGVPDQVLCGRRVCWCALEFPASPPALLVSPSAHGDGRFRVVVNAAGAHITNNLLGAHARPDRPLAAEQWDELASWLRGSEAQEQWRGLARLHSGALRKLEPRAARSILVPQKIAGLLGG